MINPEGKTVDEVVAEMNKAADDWAAANPEQYQREIGEIEAFESSDLANEDGTLYEPTHERHQRTDHRRSERAWRPQRPHF